MSCDVNIHHVSLTDVDIGYFNAQMRFTPPLRSARDRDAIVAATADGTIDALCSDHTPVDDDEKLLPFAEATPGATGLELLLPLTLRWAREHKVPLAQALARITSEPARAVGLPAGTLAVGAAADVCLFDPEQARKVERRSLRSQARTRRGWATRCRARCARRWSAATSCTTRTDGRRSWSGCASWDWCCTVRGH